MKRKIIIPFGFLLLGTVGSLYASRAKPAENPVEVFEKSSENKALALQRKTQINMNVPINRTLFYGTRNSFNSSAYAKFASNQKYTLSDQLRLGARFIELEVHWTLNKRGSKELLLCRGENEKDHKGCNINDRSFQDGLEEIRQWMLKSENQNEILLLYVKDRLDGNYSKALQALTNVLGRWLYNHSGKCTDSYSASEMPKLGRMAETGSRILLMSDTCQSGAGSETWSAYFKKNFFSTFQPKNFRGYPDCNFSREIYKNSFVRVSNGTTSKNTPDPSDSFTNSGIQSMLACEVNVFGIDQFDSDLAKQALWSWDKSEPRYEGGNCARIWLNGRWSAFHCNAKFQFACRDTQTGNWAVTSGNSGPWGHGSSACLFYGVDQTNQSGLGRYQFVAPETPYENKKLQDVVKSNGNNETVWINMTKKGENDWAPDNRVSGYFQTR
ncbi:hypothetical protein [Leptospira alstonii]|uniref:Phosphatidylinositol diacylglycerol-lyase n=2 Tax=Leptospira alstonii TaxID=28452 RepID=M6CYV8_9LEPT|nr:hypothetical protein [Leptospira alstonii]EMJ95696.1 hypothetical protein LEP1GSC194_2368 [Leptospira alstonii serovar Sichuan str. 79601]EQA80594.1 hypothetical protein LEP1GSC193_3849 [Leptospira alstonii serovar Pingchang str. 80-412]